MSRSFAQVIRQLLPMAVMGVVASLVLFGIVFNLERTTSEARFRELAEQRIIAIRANVAIAEDGVDLLVGHFAVSPALSTSRDGFRLLVDRTLTKQPFIQGYSWDPRVSRADRPAFEERARRDGLGGFQFTERDAAGKSRPVANRAEYIPIYYMEPMATNKSALGFDLASHPVRRMALDSGRDKGLPQATGRITLVQEYGDQYGILILAPVFGMTGPGNLDANRRSLTGYVSGVFRIGDLINSLAISESKASVLPLVDIHLFDMSAAESERLLYPKGDPRSPAELTAGLHVAKSFNVAGRTWSLIATPSEAYLSSTRPLASYVMLAVALLATALFVSFLNGRIVQAENATAFAHEVGRARQRLHEAQKIARMGSIEIDSVQGLFSAGEGASKILGLIPGRGPHPVDAILVNIHPDDRERVKLAFLDADGGSTDVEFRIEIGDGHRVLHARAGETADEGLSIITLQDVTARRAAEEERAGMIRRIAESERFEALGTLAGGIAHEINTPSQYVGDNLEFLASAFPDLLDVIQGCLNVIDTLRGRKEFSQAVAQVDALSQEADLDYLRRELPTAIEHSRDGVRQISSIVLAMKEFSHPSEKEKSFVDLNHALENTLTISRNAWKHLALADRQLDSAIPTVPCLPGEMNQVFLNLIVNAAQALAEAGRTPDAGRITVSTSVEGEQAVIRIADNGTGISADIQDKIFNPFFTTKAVGKGTGQGLAIAQDIVVVKHGGTIDFETVLGQGTTFTIRLPLALGASGVGKSGQLGGRNGNTGS